MVSAAGSGELLFTPGVGALHEYELLWAMLIAIAFKWVQWPAAAASAAAGVFFAGFAVYYLIQLLGG